MSQALSTLALPLTKLETAILAAYHQQPGNAKEIACRIGCSYKTVKKAMARLRSLGHLPALPPKMDPDAADAAVLALWDECHRSIHAVAQRMGCCCDTARKAVDRLRKAGRLSAKPRRTPEAEYSLGQRFAFRDLTPFERDVLDAWDRFETYEPTAAEIAVVTGVHRGTVGIAMKHLRAAGLLPDTPWTRIDEPADEPDEDTRRAIEHRRDAIRAVKPPAFCVRGWTPPVVHHVIPVRRNRDLE